MLKNWHIPRNYFLQVCDKVVVKGDNEATKLTQELKQLSDLTRQTYKKRCICWNHLTVQSSTLTHKVTCPVGTVRPRIYWSCKIFTCPRIFSHNIIRHLMCEIVNKNTPWCLLALFYQPKPFFTIFTGQRCTVSVEPCSRFNNFCKRWLHVSDHRTRNDMIAENIFSFTSFEKIAVKDLQNSDICAKNDATTQKFIDSTSHSRYQWYRTTISFYRYWTCIDRKDKITMTYMLGIVNVLHVCFLI